MQLGMIGLGRMGNDMARRLMHGGHRCVVFDTNTKAVQALAQEGATPADSLAQFIAQLDTPRVVWLMLPAAIVDKELALLTPLLAPGDIVIDGGNSYYRDDIRRGDELRARGLHYVDVGTSGGVAGLGRGYCLMVGGEPEIFAHLTPIFATLAPGVGTVLPTPTRTANEGTADQGFLHCGPQGAGHFVKMVHNGIEYGIMAAYAEGLNILRNADVGMREHAADAETTPMREPAYYQYKLDLPEITEVWRRGSVIGSWLLDLTASALHEAPDLEQFSGAVSDSGEGRWVVAAALDEGVPANVISAALFSRFSSRGEGDFADRLLSAMRKQFGGHDEKKAGA